MINLRENTKLMSEINIIPFTDIVLVILIIFIITTPLMIQSAIKVKLPQTQPNQTLTREDKVDIVISKKMVYLNNREIKDLGQLDRELRMIMDHPKAVMISADKSVSYGLVARVLSVVHRNSALKIELLTQNAVNQL